MQSAYFPARREGQVMICDLFAFPIQQSVLIDIIKINPEGQSGTLKTILFSVRKYCTEPPGERRVKEDVSLISSHS